MNSLQLTSLFPAHDLPEGRLVWWSKSEYRRQFPENVVVFNANVFADLNGDFGKCWFGDLDLTFSAAELQKIANESKATLYVLHEMDGRFENESIPIEEAQKKAVRVFLPMYIKNDQ